MEDISKLKDFYIDLDGDVKAVTAEFTCTFVTDTDKLNSKYIFANNVTEIKDAIHKVNPGFILDSTVFKEYSLKSNQANEVKAVKIFMDYTDEHDGMDVILMGVEIYNDKIVKDYYFFSERVDVDQFIKSNNLIYQVMDSETHKPILYSVKYETKNSIEIIVNFKTYYALNDTAFLYNKNMVASLKESLRF